MSKEALEQLEQESKDLIPTPRIGEIVLWYEHGQVKSDNGRPAIVEHIEDFGRVQLTLLGSLRGAKKTGVKYMTMDGASNSRLDVTYRMGCWGFRDGETPTKSTDRAFQKHLESLSRRKEAIVNRMNAEKADRALESQRPAPVSADDDFSLEQEKDSGKKETAKSK